MYRYAPGAGQYAAKTRQTEAPPQGVCRALPWPRHCYGRAVAQFVLEGSLLRKTDVLLLRRHREVQVQSYAAAHHAYGGR
jgi:hypothetical protein